MSRRDICAKIPAMKFGATFNDYLHQEQQRFLTHSSHVEYKRLKKVLKSCRRCRELKEREGCDVQLEGSKQSESEFCQYEACPLCDQLFFAELTKEASEVTGFFSSRVKRLLHLHASSGMQKYMWRLRNCFRDDTQLIVQKGRVLLDYVTVNAIAIRKILKKYDKIHGSVSGRDFKSKMLVKRIEPLHSPWLMELGALYLNYTGSDAGEPGDFFRNFSCDLKGDQPVITMTISDTLKYEYSLTCPICLETVFNPYALNCGHLFCKICAYSAASVRLFESLKTAPVEARCPLCRATGVFKEAVHMMELDLLLKSRCKDEWKERLRGERAEMVKQAKEYWEEQTVLTIGFP